MARLDGFLERYSTYWVILFFAGYLLLGFSLFRDYGVGFDEENCRQRGILAYNYVVYNDQTLLTYDRKFMGQLFDMSLAAVEKNFSVFKDTREIYFMRHLAIFLSFYIGVIFFYRLCLQRFNSWKIALLGCFLLVSSPRLFAHSFYNAKDIPFLAAVIASMFTLNRFLDRKDRASALWHGLACAIAAGVRPVGLFMVALTTAFYAAEAGRIWCTEDRIPKEAAPRIITTFLVYVACAGFGIFLFWPALWAGFSNQVSDIVELSSRFPSVYGTFYMGRTYLASEVPWHYLPVWILISTPYAYSACFLVGAFVLLRGLASNPRTFFASRRDDVISLLMVALPVISVTFSISAAKIALYSTWRHFFFIYPAFLLIALTGLLTSLDLIRRTRVPGIVRGVTLALWIAFFLWSVADALGFMVRNHPYEGLYFNRLAGGNMQEAKKNFEMDDWGLSYRQALEYILKTDASPTIPIIVSMIPGYLTQFILPVEERRRLVYVKAFQGAKYYLNNPRGFPRIYMDEYYSIKVDGAKIITVYRVDHAS